MPGGDILSFRNLSVAVAAIVLVFGFAGSGAAQEPPKPVIGVRTFENPPHYHNSTIGSGLTDLFITELMKTGRYRVVERDGIDELVSEIELGESDLGEKSTALAKGHFKGLEYLVIGKVTNFGERETNSGAAAVIAGIGLRKTEGYVRIDFRVVDAASREIIYSGFAEGLDKTSGWSFGGPGGAASTSSRSFLDSQLGRATVKAISRMVRTMNHDVVARHVSRTSELRRQQNEPGAGATGRVLARAGPQVAIISLGSNQGVRPGDTLRVLRLGQIKDSKGNVVYSDEVETGRIRVTEVQEDRAKAVVLTEGGVEEGYRVRK
jgi:curli biogenesis system outer membrane secretion channel CsgG